MKKPLPKSKKRLIINWCLVGLCVLVLSGVLIADAVTNNVTDVAPTKEQAQQTIEEALASLPLFKTSWCATYTAQQSTEIEIVSIEQGAEREYVVHVKYTHPDLGTLYNEHKNELFAVAYQTTLQGSSNASTIQKALSDYAKENALIEQAASVSGEADIYLYSTLQGDYVMHLSDAAVDALLGDVAAISKDIASTNEIRVDGKFVSIANNNTIRRGVDQFFGTANYDDAKPDTASPLHQKINDIKDEFYRNFMEDDHWKYLVQGLGNTLAITALALLLGIGLGVITSLIRIVYDKTDKLYYLDKLVKAYIAVIRGTPVMVQLLIIYFVLLLPIGIEKFPAAVLCFGLNSGAYVSEIIRGGIMSIDQGQTEAGRSLGFGFWPTMWHIVIPQAFKVVLPSLCNEFITLLKETSVAFYIGVADLTQGGIKIRSQTYSNFMPLLAVAIIYFVLVLGLTKLVGMLERRLRKSER